MNSVHHSRFASGSLVGFTACLMAIAIGLLLTGAPAAFSQSIYADLSGTVTDATGAVVPGVKINVQNTQTQVVRQLVTNDTGYFSATQLPTGVYNVSVEAQGFKKWQGKGIVLNSSDNKTLTISLQIGTESETVEVIGTAGDVAVTDSGEKSSNLSSEQIQRLSLIGRNATEFLKILPGSAQISLGGTNRPATDGSIIGINGFTVNGSAGGMAGTSINGQQATGLSINQDGQNVEDPGGPGSATPVNPNPDMISEMKVMTSNYGADSAKGPVVINTITRSGGSSFHGDVHFYARNSALNAEEHFSKAQEALDGNKPGYLKIPSHYYYPGFDFGGPVLIPGTKFNKDRNKYFFHESFENYRQLIDGGINRAFVPTSDMINKGDFSILNTWNAGGFQTRSHLGAVPALSGGSWSGRPGCTISAAGVLDSTCISPAAQLWMQNSLPAPNLAAPDANGFNYVMPVQQSQNSTQNAVKFDANFSENTKLFVSWSRQRETAIMPLGLWQGSGDWIIPSPSQTTGANKSDFYTLNFLHLFSPTLTMEARIGYTHMDMPGVPTSPNKVLRDKMNFPLKGVFGNPNAPVVTSWGGTVPNIGDIGHDYHPTFSAEKGIPSGGADLTKVYKTHTLKFGGNWERKYNSQDAWNQYMGVFAYGEWSSSASGNNYADMLMGENSGYFEQALPPAIKMVQVVPSFYATDHWKLNRRLTVDYGMRFEHYGAGYPDDKWGAATFDSSKYVDGVKNSGLSWYSLNHSTPKAGAKLDFLVYSPRFGAAFDLFGNGRTVIRGGWGQYRYGNYVVASQGAANTALGSVGWSAPGAAQTWEQLDQFINDGSGSCVANQPGGIDAGNNHCAPTVVFGVPTDFTNQSVSVVDPHNHDQPYTTTYSLNIDQQLPNKFMFELSYVGNHSNLTQNGVNINSVPLGAMTNSTVASVCGDLDSGDLNKEYGDSDCQQRFRPYKNYKDLSANKSSGRSRYDSLQTSLTRSAGWATISVNYAFSKVLGNTNQSAAFKDYGISEYWSPLNYNRGHVFNASYIFQLPSPFKGRGRGCEDVAHCGPFLGGLLNGWEVSGITQVQSGAMLTAVNGYQFNLANSAGGEQLVGSPNVTVGPILTCNPKMGLQNGQYVNGNCFAVPVNGGTTIGNTRFPYLAGPKYWNSDITLAKKFTIAEHQSLQFRFSAFNFMNHALTSFSNGDGNLKLNFDSTTHKLLNATDPVHACPGPQCQAFGYPDVHYGLRRLELSAKYTF